VKLGQIKKLAADGKSAGAEQDGLYKEAKTFFERAIEQKKNLAVAYYNLAVVESHLKDVDGAVTNAEQALGYDRSNLNYAYNLGVLYQLRNNDGDKALAEKMFKDILANNEKLVDVRLSLGLLYEDMGKKDMAVEEYNKILGFLPADGTDNIKKTREQVQKLIDNVKSGAGNLTKKSADVPAVSAPVVQPPTLQSPVAPIGAPLPPAGQ
jgi:tetratricopeptide (TPR) repeat protein